MPSQHSETAMSEQDNDDAFDPSVLPQMAEQIIDLMHRSGTAEFGFDRQSVDKISRFLTLMAERGRGGNGGTSPELRMMTPLAAAFVGECLRLEQGGEWKWHNEEIVVVLSNGVVCAPFAMAEKQSTGRSDSENLATLYGAMSVFGALSVDELYLVARGQLDLSDRFEAAGVAVAPLEIMTDDEDEE
jgi:hypothetical protein